jgi:hypothetical protein
MLFVVPSERHVERLAREGAESETRASLRERLSAALLRDVRYADERETRLVLAMALEDARATAKQLDLFGTTDPLLATLKDRGGASWVRATEAIHAAIGELRARGVTEAHLERVRGTGVTATRARTLAAAMRALDAALEASGKRDGRHLGGDLALAIRAAGAERLAEMTTRQLRARFLLAWAPSDLAWWRALDETLARIGGFARLVLPGIDRKLEGSRERDPLEAFSDAMASALDAAPEIEPVDDRREAASLARAANTLDQARIVARLVGDALDAGTAVERIVVALPRREDRTLLPIRRALAAEEIVVAESAAAPLSSIPVIATGIAALVAAETKDRVAVARVLRSGYVDASRMFPDLPFREAESRLVKLARALLARATRAGADEAARLLATGGEELAPVVRALEAAAGSRVDHVRAARRVFHAFGFAERAGRGGLAAFARDEALRDVDDAERTAVARDVRAWDLLEGILDTYETIVARSDRPVSAETFRQELIDLLDAAGTTPSASRAGAVRIMRLEDVPGETLDLLVVVDANEGVLPRDVRPISLVSEGLESAVERFQGVAPREGDASRELVALAWADAARVVFITTAEDGSDTPAAPSRFVRDLPQIVVEALPARDDVADIALRVAREAKREAFFLDPARPLSPLVGALASSATVLTTETGSTPERALAVTSLERFAQCAFKGYATVVLGAREAEAQRELPDAREEGNLAHAAVAAAFIATRELWPRHPRDADRILRDGIEASDRALDAAEGHAPLRAVVRLRVRESVRAILLRAIEDEAWSFAHAEQAFGAGKPWPPFRVDGIDLWLRGSIDRIDRAQGRARVVDYKRSKSTVRTAMASLGESALQVPIYAAVAARQLEVPTTGSYLPMQLRDLATERPGRDKEDRVAMLSARKPGGSEIERRVRALVTDVRAGQLAPLPARESECTHCGVSGGCRKPRFAMAPDEEVDE